MGESLPDRDNFGRKVAKRRVGRQPEEVLRQCEATPQFVSSWLYDVAKHIQKYTQASLWPGTALALRTTSPGVSAVPPQSALPSSPGS